MSKSYLYFCKVTGKFYDTLEELYQAQTSEMYKELKINSNESESLNVCNSK